MKPDPLVIYAKHLATRTAEAEPLRRKAAARAIVQRLMSSKGLREQLVVGDEGDETVIEFAGTEALRLVMPQFFGHFGYNAGCEALSAELDRLSAIRNGKGGRPPAAVSRARRSLSPYMRGRGSPGGKAKTDPDRLQYRDRYWMLLWERLTAEGKRPMQVYRHIARGERLEIITVKTRLNKLKRDAAKAAAALKPEDIAW